ncbi:MAG TPA: oligosaccharide flippase family protein [Candidatus Acidoferrales bacterium]|nr:oligosaccharide flippase family protein [Candidatus Acidoferrales bacterium]
MGKTSATGSFHLLIGVAGSTAIMAIGTIVLAILLPVNEVGLYGMALIPATMISFFRDWGITSALTQQIAYLRAENRTAEIHDVVFSGIVFEIISGALLALVCFALAQPIAYILSPNTESNLTIYIQIMSLSVFAGALASAAGGIFTGYERMKLNSFIQIFQAIVKTGMGPLLIILGFGVLGAVYAAMVSVLAGGVIAVLLVYFAFYRHLRQTHSGKVDLEKTLKPMLQYGVPLTFSNLVIGVLPQVFIFMMATYANQGDVLTGYPSGWMIGNYYASIYFATLLSFIATPISTALFPMFSKLNPKKNPDLLKTVFASSVKYTSLLMVPATLAIMTLSVPLLNTIFPAEGNLFQSFYLVLDGTKYPYGPMFLVISSLVYLLVLTGNISLGTFQTGIGKTRQVMYQSLLSLSIGIPLALSMVAYFYTIGGAPFAVIGGLIGSLIAAIPGVAWGLYWSWKNYRVKADFGNSAKILVSAALASITAFLVISFLDMRLPYGFVLIAGIVVFLLVYLASVPLLGAVNRMDIINFKVMFSGLGIVSKVLDLPLLFMHKICRDKPEAKVTLKTEIEL